MPHQAGAVKLAWRLAGDSWQMWWHTADVLQMYWRSTDMAAHVMTSAVLASR